MSRLRLRKDGYTLRSRARRPKRTRFGGLRDPKTHHRISGRPTGGVVVYEQQPCRRCGVSIQRGNSVIGRCACQIVKAQPKSPMQKRRRKATPPSPGMIFAAYVAKPTGR